MNVCKCAMLAELFKKYSPLYNMVLVPTCVNSWIVRHVLEMRVKIHHTCWSPLCGEFAGPVGFVCQSVSCFRFFFRARYMVQVSERWLPDRKVAS